MESQRRRMIWFEITKRRLLNEQNKQEDTNHEQSEIPPQNSNSNWDDENDYVSQR